MPAATGAAVHTLGLELAVDALRATIVDEHLDIVGVESVEFDTDLPEYRTQGGFFTTPGEAYMTPVDMWVRALDVLMQRLSEAHDLSKVKAISGCAQSAFVWWKASPLDTLSNLIASQPLHPQIGPSSFSLPHTPIAQDTSPLPHAHALESALGGPDLMAARVGTAAHASLCAAHAMKIREQHPLDVWARTARLMPASAFLASLLMGAWAPLGEAEACATGMWSHLNRQWDERALEVVAGGSREEAVRLRRMLGEVDLTGGVRPIGMIALYYVERYGFDRETTLTSFTSDFLATYLSLCPAPSDSLISFGPFDMMMTAAPQYIPSRAYQLFPHPAQDLGTNVGPGGGGERRRYVAVLVSRNGDVPRALVRDMYTKSWSAFDRLVAIVPPGGSIGLDDKLFSFWILQNDTHPFSHTKGIFRFETGVKVNEFRDLRANPRCLLESQMLALRTRYAHMVASPLFYPLSSSRSTAGSTGGGSAPGSVAGSARPSPLPHVQHQRTYGASYNASLGLSFDPYDPTALPRRLITTGAAANFPALINLLTDVFNAPIYTPQSQLDSVALSVSHAHRNGPARGVTSRAALGAAYVARWCWGRGERAEGERYNAYEDEMRRLLAKRWNAGGAARAAAAAAAAAQAQAGTGTPGPNTPSARSTPPFGQGRSGLGAMVVMEEEEDKAAELERLAMLGAMGAGGSSTSLVSNSPNGFGSMSMYGSDSGGGGMPLRSPLGMGMGMEDPEALLMRMASRNSPNTTHAALNMPQISYTAAAPDGTLSSSGGFNLATTGFQQQTIPQLGSLALNVPPPPSANGQGGQGPPGSQGQQGGAGAQQGQGQGQGQGAQGGAAAQAQQYLPAPLTPTCALPTNDAEAQLGLAKVAEPDHDAFAAYASIVPEYARLERQLAKALV